MEQLVRPLEPAKTRTFLEDLVGRPLSVVFAEGDVIARVRDRGQGELPLVPPFHVSDEDAYLVLPDDIGLEIIDILADGDLELLDEALRDGLVCLAEVGQDRRGEMELAVEACLSARDVLARGLDYAATIPLEGERDVVERIDALPHLACTMVSKLVDDEGLDEILREDEHAGTSWREPVGPNGSRQGVDPTYVFSRRIGPSRVGIELALFVEYEELVALLRPVALVV